MGQPGLKSEYQDTQGYTEKPVFKNKKHFFLKKIWKQIRELLGVAQQFFKSAVSPPWVLEKSVTLVRD